MLSAARILGTMADSVRSEMLLTSVAVNVQQSTHRVKHGGDPIFQGSPERGPHSRLEIALQGW